MRIQINPSSASGARSLGLPWSDNVPSGNPDLEPTSRIDRIDTGALYKYPSITRTSKPSMTQPTAAPTKPLPLAEQLYNTRARCNIMMSEVSMYFDATWRTGLFTQLDHLLDPENWEEVDAPISEASFRTFLHMLLLLHPAKRPGLGATSDGRVIATWTVHDARLTLECLPGDRVRWVIHRSIEGEPERGAGQVGLRRLREVLIPYDPDIWFAAHGR